jgi:hypothetical protein
VHLLRGAIDCGRTLGNIVLAGMFQIKSGAWRKKHLLAEPLSLGNVPL